MIFVTKRLTHFSLSFISSYDSGFVIFNFMRLWDGYRLIRWFSTVSHNPRELVVIIINDISMIFLCIYDLVRKQWSCGRTF